MLDSALLEAEAFRLRREQPHVHGFAWQHPSPSAVLVLVHGLQSHAGWFTPAAEALRERGTAVYALDRRGSGTSPGVRGDIDRWGEWLDEIDAVVRLARSEHPETPVHLVGHCFGANLALACSLERRPPIRSLVLLTPGLHVLPAYSPLEKVRMAACGLLDPRARFRVPQRDELFTRDPGTLAWIQADSSGARTLTARCAVEIERMRRRVHRDLSRLRHPLLVIEAEHDRIADNERNRESLGRALGGRFRVATFDAEHFLLAEPCRADVLDLIVRWTSSTDPTPDQGETTC